MTIKNTPRYIRILSRSLLYPSLLSRAIPWNHSFKRITNALALFGDIIEDDQYHARDFIKKGAVVIDGGGNIGIFACLAASLGATVYSFEPYPEAFKILRERVRYYPNIIPVPLGLGEKEKEVFLLQGGKHWFGSSMVEDSGLRPEKYGESGWEKIKITLTTVDDFVKKYDLPRVDFIKLDTEGYEKKILEGAKGTLQQFHPTVACSAYHHEEDKEELPALMRQFSYAAALHKSADEDFIFT